MEKEKIALSIKDLCYILDTDSKTLDIFIRYQLKIKPEKKNQRCYSIANCKKIIQKWYKKNKNLKYEIFESKMNKE